MYKYNSTKPNIIYLYNGFAISASLARNMFLNKYIIIKKMLRAVLFINKVFFFAINQTFRKVTTRDD